MKVTIAYSVLRKAISTWSDAHASTCGAALAYYTSFSLAPLLVIALSLATPIFGPEAARHELQANIQSTVGPAVAESIEEMISHAHQVGTGGMALVLGIGTLLIGASAVFGELQNSLNAIWQVKPKPGLGIREFFRERLLSMGLVLATAFVLLTSLTLSAVLTWLSSAWTPKSMPGGVYFWQAINQVVSFCIITLLFALIYRLVPDATTSWRDIALGSALTAILFNVGKYFLGLYLGSAAFETAYGAVGSLAALLFWVYYSAQIFLFGAATTRALAERSGRGVEPSPNAIPDSLNAK